MDALVEPIARARPAREPKARTQKRSNPFPFTAIVGQDEMKLALLAASVDPGLGGVLVLGDRGTGKSTAVRALAALLPDMRVVEGCRYHCDPKSSRASCVSGCVLRGGARVQTGRVQTGRVQTGRVQTGRVPVPIVDLPLGATEDSVVGALDLERALTRGIRAFEPGLLARAHRGFLYIDEVNLLEDHLVDLLLDVAASGENVVERDGISLRHPARFVLVGSGNPEEGDLRPQMLDRFGLSVDVHTPRDLAGRIEVVRRRDRFERDPVAFGRLWADEELALRARIVAARAAFASIEVPDAMLERAASLCLELGTDGLRGELTLIRAARAVAALEADGVVTLAHLRRLAVPALRHRLRRNPLDECDAAVRVERALDSVFGG